jgi:hypothetical protein
VYIALRRINETKIAHLNEIVDLNDPTHAPMIKMRDTAHLSKLGFYEAAR